MNTTDKTQNHSDNFKDLPFEFILYVNNHIVCQRFFNVSNFKEESLKSRELIDMMKRIGGMNMGQFGQMGIIPTYLKEKSMDYLWENFNPYETQSEVTYKATNKKGDMFKFEFKVGGRVTSEIEFPNEFFTLNSRSNVDIRLIIPEIISEIKETLSKKRYTLV